MSSIKKNFVLQFAYQLLNSILPFLTSPYISRVLGADNLGVYSYTFAIVNYFVLFANLGIANYGNRLIATTRNDEESLNRSFSSLLGLHLSVGFLVSLLYCLYVFFIAADYKPILLIQGMVLLSAVFDISWFFFGIEKFKITVTRNTIIRILGVVCIFLFVREKNDLIIYTIIMAGTTLLNQLLLWLFIRNEVKIVKVKIAEIVNHIKPLLILFAAVLAISVFSYMDKIMLGMMCSKDQLGYYENSMKVIQFPVGLITALGTVMLPRMANVYSTGDDSKAQGYIHKSMMFSMFLALPLALGISAIADKFSVLFWGNEFASCGSIMQILSITCVFMSWNSVVRTQYLIPKEKDKIYLGAVCGGALVNVVANYLLIPLYGADGAAIGTVLAYLSVFLIQNIACFRNLCVVRYAYDSLYFLFSSIVMYVCVRILDSFLDSKLWCLVSEVLVAVVVYMGFATVYMLFSKGDFAKYMRTNLKIFRRS